MRSFPPYKAEPAWRDIGRVLRSCSTGANDRMENETSRAQPFGILQQQAPRFRGLQVSYDQVELLGMEFGAANRTRTCDPVITNDVLYQLSYCGGPNAASGVSRKRPHLISGTAPIGKKNAGPTKRFRATWAQVRVKNTRQTNNLEP